MIQRYAAAGLLAVCGASPLAHRRPALGQIDLQGEAHERRIEDRVPAGAGVHVHAVAADRAGGVPDPTRVVLPALVHRMVKLSAVAENELAPAGRKGHAEALGGDLWLLTHPDIRRTARIRAVTDFLYQALRAERARLAGTTGG